MAVQKRVKNILADKRSSLGIMHFSHRDRTNNFFFGGGAVALRPNAGHGLLILDVSRSHTTTHHSRQDSSGRVISSSQRPLPDNTRHLQQTNIHASGGIRTHDLSRRAAAAFNVGTVHLKRRIFVFCHIIYILYRITRQTAIYCVLFIKNLVLILEKQMYI